MELRKLLLVIIAIVGTLGIFLVAQAQSPTYGLGKTPSPDEIRAWDIAISPEGKELPEGSGSAKEGAELYAQKCAACHGKGGYEGRAPQLIKADPAAMAKLPPCLSPCIRGGNVMAIHSPYATTIWDYINRGMPFGKEGTLKPEEVYAITAFLLYKNGVIPEDQVLDAHNLPQIKMPNQNGYVLPDYKPHTPRPFAYKP
jgi:S-disulfanyl-L-cysteine oxidoreductase SoxD